MTKKTIDKKESWWQHLWLKLAIFCLGRLGTSMKLAYSLEFVTAYLFQLGNGQGKSLTYVSYNPKYKDCLVEVTLDSIERLKESYLEGRRQQQEAGGGGDSDGGDSYHH